MIRSSAVAILVLGLLLISRFAIGETPSETPKPSKFERARSIETGDLARALDPRFERVLTGGRWCDRDRSGYFRIVVCAGGFEEAYHWMFIQLIEIDEENHNVKVKETINIRELSGLDKVLTDLTIESPDRLTCADLSVVGTVRTRGLQEGGKEQFRVRVSGDGRYRIEM